MITELIDSLYNLIAETGFHHPLHPAMTHLPVGLVLGALLFGLTSMIFKKELLVKTARHCIILALITVPPAFFLGLMDWWRFFRGGWLNQIIIKLCLAGFLIIILPIIIIMTRKQKSWTRSTLAIHGIAALVVIGLGFFGGDLFTGPKNKVITQTPQVQSDKTSQTQEPTKKIDPQKMETQLVKIGANLFNQKCGGCHSTGSETGAGGIPGLKGLFKDYKMKTKSGMSVNEQLIIQLLKKPPKGMPSFSNEPEENIKAIIAYLKTL